LKKLKEKLRTKLFKKPKIIVILGPTASGKSELAVKIAKKFTPHLLKIKSAGFNGFEIISADSRQIYKGLDIGSGKITKKEMQGVPHHLLDIASPKRVFTVAQYQKLAKKALKDILKKGKLPIICGGTGFYIDALIYDYQFPRVPPQPKLRKQLEKKSTEELFAQLQKLDPERAKNIDKHNRRRLIRALEIVMTTGKPVPRLNNISVNQRKSATALTVLKIGIKKSPEKLKKLIKKRLLKRLKMGMIEEVEKLHYQQGLSWKRLDDLGLEYRYVARYLRQRAQINADPTWTDAGKKKILKKLEQKMIETLNKEIYRYAKRQMTWFKKDKEIHWIENKKQAYNLIYKIIS
jgi:tRNA dimethylallyltransferase